MEERVSYLVRQLNSRFPGASVDDTLAAAAALLSDPRLAEGVETAIVEETLWRGRVGAVMDEAVALLSAHGGNPSRPEAVSSAVRQAVQNNPWTGHTNLSPDDATPSMASLDGAMYYGGDDEATPEECPVAVAAAGPAAGTPPQLHGGEGDMGRPLREAESASRLAEEMCRAVYEGLYTRTVLDVREEDDDDGDGHASRGGGSEDLPAPLCSLIIECESSGNQHQHRQRGDGGEGLPAPPPEEVRFVVGCSWVQWEYLRRGPLACRCPPYPTHPAATADDRRQWRQRHCSVQLLHPVSDFLQHRNMASGAAAADTMTTASSDMTTTNVEYDLSDRTIVLRSLLGLAMRVWGECDAHLVAQIRSMEDTRPTHTYHSDVFWGHFPQNIPPPVRRGDRASLRGCHLPTPLLPGEYADDSDDDDDEDVHSNGGAGAEESQGTNGPSRHRSLLV